MASRTLVKSVKSCMACASALARTRPQPPGRSSLSIPLPFQRPCKEGPVQQTIAAPDALNAPPSKPVAGGGPCSGGGPPNRMPGLVHRMKVISRWWPQRDEDDVLWTDVATPIPIAVDYPSSLGVIFSGCLEWTFTHEGEERTLRQSACGVHDEALEDAIRAVFSLPPERTLCLHSRATGAVMAASLSLASGTYEVVTDLDQDLITHLAAPKLHEAITRRSTVRDVARALDCAGLGSILPDLKELDGASLLSLPLDVLSSKYAYSGWRLRAAHSLHDALHPATQVKVLLDGSFASSGSEWCSGTVQSEQELRTLLTQLDAAALRCRETNALIVRFEDIESGMTYVPVVVSGRALRAVMGSGGVVAGGEARRGMGTGGKVRRAMGSGAMTVEERGPGVMGGGAVPGGVEWILEAMDGYEEISEGSGEMSWVEAGRSVRGGGPYIGGRVNGAVSGCDKEVTVGEGSVEVLSARGVVGGVEWMLETMDGASLEIAPRGLGQSKWRGAGRASRRWRVHGSSR